MPSPPIQCPKCLRRLELTPDWITCPACESVLRIEVFPALLRETAPSQTAEVVLVEGESTCFYHSNKKAVLPCEACGRFLCALCDCELNRQHFCPVCLEVGKTKGKIKNLENRRTLYDSIALYLTIIPLITLIFWFFTIVTAPIALFIAIRHWNAPRSIVHRTKVRYVLAIILATIEIAGWVLFISAIWVNLSA